MSIFNLTHSIKSQQALPRGTTWRFREWNLFPTTDRITGQLLNPLVASFIPAPVLEQVLAQPQVCSDWINIKSRPNGHTLVHTHIPFALTYAKPSPLYARGLDTCTLNLVRLTYNHPAEVPWFHCDGVLLAPVPLGEFHSLCYSHIQKQYDWLNFESLLFIFWTFTLDTKVSFILLQHMVSGFQNSTAS